MRHTPPPPSTPCRSDALEALRTKHAFIESLLECEYAAFRETLLPLSEEFLTQLKHEMNQEAEQQRRITWMAGNYNEQKEKALRQYELTSHAQTASALGHSIAPPRPGEGSADTRREHALLQRALQRWAVVSGATMENVFTTQLSTCPCCCCQLMPHESGTVTVYSEHKVSTARLSTKRCPKCKAIFFPYWTEGGSFPEGAVLHTGQVPTAVAVYRTLWVSCDLLQWFEDLFNFPGMTAAGYLKGCPVKDQSGRCLERRELFEAYVRYVLLLKLTSGRFDALLLRPGGHTTFEQCYRMPCSHGDHTTRAACRAVVEATIRRLRPALRAEHDDHWVTRHADFCSAKCARVMIGDGNAKLRPRGCACATDPTTSATDPEPRFCDRLPRKGCLTCNLPDHEAQENALRAERHHHHKKTRHQKRGKKRGVIRSLHTACHTRKTSDTLRAFRAGGVIAASFVCGVVAAPQRFYISESLRQVMAYFQRMRRLNMSLSLIGYDDWCHLSPYLQKHGPPELGDLRGFIDRWHMRGHRRVQCWTKFCADNYSDLWDYSFTDVTSHNVQACIAKLQRDRGLEIHNFEPNPVPTTPPSRVATELLEGRLPLVVTFSEYTLPPRNHTIRICTPGGRKRVLLALDKTTLALTLPLKGRGWDVPEGARLFSVTPHFQEVVSGYPQDVLQPMLVRLCQQRTIRVHFRRRRWTSVMERNWRQLNVLKHSLCFASPCLFDFLLLHAVGLQNERRVLKSNARKK